ncbi:Asg1p [Sugiyamaella lignohabitans]|uniref:Asg1p n=1 Tax=Sugiyamaella lignohabitans TaxID=796027 RepID=A0A161HFZ9_9ASCO|nr:Asg1p [Sugiyamaella lignohabitans]ANB11591.1 Asg1p [Sugiyamaella lignohabitans]
MSSVSSESVPGVRRGSNNSNSNSSGSDSRRSSTGNNSNGSASSVGSNSTKSGDAGKTTTAEPQKRKRNRAHKSCLPCAKAKRKCCKQTPCTNCRIRGLECTYDVPTAKSQRNSASRAPARIAESVSGTVSDADVKTEDLENSPGPNSVSSVTSSSAMTPVPTSASQSVGLVSGGGPSTVSITGAGPVHIPNANDRSPVPQLSRTSAITNIRYPLVVGTGNRFSGSSINFEANVNLLPGSQIPRTDSSSTVNVGSGLTGSGLTSSSLAGSGLTSSSLAGSGLTGSSLAGSGLVSSGPAGSNMVSGAGASSGTSINSVSSSGLNSQYNTGAGMTFTSSAPGSGPNSVPNTGNTTATPDSICSSCTDDPGSVTSASSMTSSGGNCTTGPDGVGNMCASAFVSSATNGSSPNANATAASIANKHGISTHGSMLGSSSSDIHGKIDFVLRLGESNQRTVSRYYGPSSGPSLLLCRGPYSFMDGDLSYFPVDSIPDMELILQAYYDRLHWYIGCFEWQELRNSLKTENVSCINSAIYMVLSLGCSLLCRDEEARRYEEMSFNLSSDVLAGNRLEYSDGLLVLHLLRVHACDIGGKFEEAWAKLGMAITVAIGMGYHRKWPFPLRGEPIDTKKQRMRSRTWYSLLLTERKLALLLGRPYTIRPEFYDCDLPDNNHEFNYETSFRDALNKMVPLYTTLIDEVHKSEPSNAKLTELDQQVSEWTFSQGCELSYSFNIEEYDSPFKNVIIMQRLYILVIKNFFRSRMHRLFLSSENRTHRMYSTEQYFLSNFEFCTHVTELMKYERSFGLTELVTFLVDNALFYSIKLATTDQFILCGDCAKTTAAKLHYLLELTVSEQCRPNRSTSSIRIAKSGLKIIETLESLYNQPAGTKPSPDEGVEMLKKASKLPHPYEDQSSTPGSSGFSNYSQQQQQPEQRPNDIFSRPPLSFDLSDWDNWLQEFPLDQYWSQI